MNSLSVASEPPFQLSEGHAHLKVLQVEQTHPAKFKVHIVSNSAISARSVLPKFNMCTRDLGHLVELQLLVP